ncbi:unnamed protein product [Chrysoparadoxa australica]
MDNLYDNTFDDLLCGKETGEELVQILDEAKLYILHRDKEHRRRIQESVAAVYQDLHNLKRVAEDLRERAMLSSATRQFLKKKRLYTQGPPEFKQMLKELARDYVAEQDAEVPEGEVLRWIDSAYSPTTSAFDNSKQRAYPSEGGWSTPVQLTYGESSTEESSVKTDAEDEKKVTEEDEDVIFIKVVNTFGPPLIGAKREREE